MSDTSIRTDDVLAFSLSDCVCSFCGKHFKNAGGVWYQLCPECRECPSCGSTFLVWHRRTDDKPEKPFVRCLRCMHGREASDV